MRSLTCLALSLLLVIGVVSSAAGAENQPAKGPVPVVLITGSNRGIGLALAQVYAERGWNVIATCRDPSKAYELNALATTNTKVHVESLDVISGASLDALVARLHGQPIDVLINNAGVLGDPAAENLPHFDETSFSGVMSVNTFGPLSVSAALLENVVASQQKKIVTLTSRSGSIGSIGTAHDSYYYRMSKAAVNMGMRLFQNDVRNRGVTVGLISPGPVDTDMNRTYRRNAPAGPGILSPRQSATAVQALIEKLDAVTAGRFLEYDGTENPW
jgi:NAD(P)-dependent dehydrogenase (short-subunit alcohol dehydrogenase family)